MVNLKKGCGIPKLALSRVARANRKKAESLLFPMVSALYALGLEKEEIHTVVSVLYEKQRFSRKARKLQHVGHPTHYCGDIVALWTRDKRFIDDAGRPRILPFSGPNSFSALVKKINSKIDPNFVLELFKKYKTIQKANFNSYKLLTPYFCISTNNNLVFEPSMCFLLDVSVTLGRILRKRKKNLEKPQEFWRKVERRSVSIATAKKFNIFARQRSQALLEDLDEWLEVNAGVSRDKPLSDVGRRVGIGLFSISSDSEG